MPDAVATPPTPTATQTPPPGVATSTQESVPDTFTGSDYYAALEAAGQAAKAEKANQQAVPAEKPAAPAAPAEKPVDAPKETAEQPADLEDPLDQVLSRATAPKRDYTGLTDKEKKLFQNMSNESYAELRPQYDQWKALGFEPKKLTELQQEAEALRKFRYVDHPEAYKLSEEYVQASRIADNIKIVHNHWKEQLTALRSNKPVSLLTRDAEGRLVPTAPMQATPEMEATIIENLSKVSTDFQSHQRDMSELEASYKGNFDEYGRVLGDVHKQFFGKHEAALKSTADKYLERFPAFVRHKPEVRMAAYALAAMVVGAKGKTDAANAETVEKAVQAAATAAGPTAASLKTGSTKPGVSYDEADYKEFKSKYGQFIR